MSSLVDFDDFERSVRAFLRVCWDENRPGEVMPSIAVDDNLFDAGILDSLLIVEVLAHVEEAFDIVVDVTRIEDPSAFFSLRGMYEGLLSWDSARSSDSTPPSSRA